MCRPSFFHALQQNPQHAEALLLQLKALLLQLKALLLPFRDEMGKNAYFLLLNFYFHEKLGVFRETPP